MATPNPFDSLLGFDADEDELEQGIAGTTPDPAANPFESLLGLAPEAAPEAPPSAEEEPGYVSNLGRGVGERVSTLGGNFFGFAQSAGDVLENEDGVLDWVPQMGGIVHEGGWSFDYLNPKEWQEYNQDGGKLALRDLQDAMTDADFGFTSHAEENWDALKNNPSILEKAQALAAFGLEVGAISLADMAGAVITPVPYWASRSEEIAQDRAVQDGRTGAVSAKDLAIGGVTAAIITAMERFGAEQVFSAFIKGGSALRKILRAAVGESGTEFVQEQLEYGAETLGTQAGEKLTNEQYLLNSLERGAQGAVGGGTAGAGLAIPGALLSRGEDDIATDDDIVSDEVKTLEENETAIEDALAEQEPIDQQLLADSTMEEQANWENDQVDQKIAEFDLQQKTYLTSLHAIQEQRKKAPDSGLVPVKDADGQWVLRTPGMAAAMQEVAARSERMDVGLRPAEEGQIEVTEAEETDIDTLPNPTDEGIEVKEIIPHEPGKELPEYEVEEIDAEEITLRGNRIYNRPPEDGGPKPPPGGGGGAITTPEKSEKSEKSVSETVFSGAIKKGRQERPEAAGELAAVQARLDELPSNFDMESDPYQISEVQDLLAQRRELQDEVDWRVTPEESRAARAELIEKAHAEKITFPKFTTLKTMRETLAKKKTSSVRDGVYKRGVQAIADAENNGEAVTPEMLQSKLGITEKVATGILDRYSKELGVVEPDTTDVVEGEKPSEPTQAEEIKTGSRVQRNIGHAGPDGGRLMGPTGTVTKLEDKWAHVKFDGAEQGDVVPLIALGLDPTDAAEGETPSEPTQGPAQVPKDIQKIVDNLRKKYGPGFKEPNLNFQTIANQIYGPQATPEEAKFREWFEQSGWAYDGEKDAPPVENATADYYSKPGARQLNHDFKFGDKKAKAKAIKEMAEDMAKHLTGKEVLVPMPDHTGVAGDTLALAKAIAKIKGNTVKNILKGRPRESLYDLKKEGKTLSGKDFGFKQTQKTPANALIIDNVYDSGETMAAAQAVLDGAPYLTHSRVVTPKPETKGFGKRVRLKDTFPVVRHAGKEGVVYMSEENQGRTLSYIEFDDKSINTGGRGFVDNDFDVIGEAAKVTPAQVKYAIDSPTEEHPDVPGRMDTDTLPDGTVYDLSKSAETQIATTQGTYDKVNEEYFNEIESGDILDYGAGKGLSAKAHGFESLEPYPRGWTPTYQDTHKIKRQYEAIIANNILNVLPKHTRRAVLWDMAEKLRGGGQIYINVRSRSDINNTKVIQKKFSDGEILTGRGTYQKGFQRQELINFIKAELGPDYTVESAKFGSIAVMVTKNLESQRTTPDKQKTIELDAAARGQYDEVKTLDNKTKVVRMRWPRNQPATGKYSVLQHNGSRWKWLGTHYDTAEEAIEAYEAGDTDSEITGTTPDEVAAEINTPAILASQNFVEANPEFQGMQLSHVPGDDRWGKEMMNYYGDFEGTEGADGDPVDVILNKSWRDFPDAPVFIVNKNDAKGKFEQHKVMAGFDDILDAEDGFLAMYPEEELEDLQSIDAEDLQTWLHSKDTLKPYDRDKHRGKVNAGISLSKPTPKDTIVSSEELADGPDISQAMWMLADGSVVHTGGDHMAYALERGMHAEDEQDISAIVEFQREGSAIRASFFWAEAEGANVAWLHVRDAADPNDVGQKLTDAQIDSIQKFVWASKKQGKKANIMIGSTADATNPIVKKVTITGLRRNWGARKAASRAAMAKFYDSLEDKSATYTMAAVGRLQTQLLPSAQTDDLIVFIRKHGGINVNTAEASGWRGRLSHLNRDYRLPGLPGIEQTNGTGLSLDQVAEIVTEGDYIKSSPTGYDQSLLHDALERTEDGTKVYSDQNTDWMKQEAEAEWEAQMDAESDQMAAELREELAGEDISSVDEEMMSLITKASLIDEGAAEKITTSEQDNDVVKEKLRKLINEAERPKITESEGRKAAEEGARQVERKTKSETAYPRKEPVDFEPIDDLTDIERYTGETYPELDPVLMEAAIDAINTSLGMLADEGYTFAELYHEPVSILPGYLADQMSSITRVGSSAMPAQKGVAGINRGDKRMKNPENIMNRLFRWKKEIEEVLGSEVIPTSEWESHIREYYPKLSKALDKFTSSDKVAEPVPGYNELQSEMAESVGLEWGPPAKQGPMTEREVEGLPEPEAPATERGPEWGPADIATWKDAEKAVRAAIPGIPSITAQMQGKEAERAGKTPQEWADETIANPPDTSIYKVGYEPKDMAQVLDDSAKAPEGMPSLTDIPLTAEDGDRKITHNAEWWKNAIDDRIKAVDKMRGCA